MGGGWLLMTPVKSDQSLLATEYNAADRRTGGWDRRTGGTGGWTDRCQYLSDQMQSLQADTQIVK